MNQKSDFSTYPKGQKMIIRHKLMLIWAPLALCLVPILYGCTITSGGKTTTIALPGVASTSEAPKKVPSTAELTKLTEETMLTWNQGIQTKDFTEFHSTISKPFQEGVTVEEMAVGFKGFIDQDVNLEPAINALEPAFTPAPAINSDGVLVIQGYYPTTPSRVKFSLQYVSEADAWKLFHINVGFDTPKKEAEETPAEEAPAEETPAEEAPAEEAPAKDTP
ncbi:hypothetical protein [Microcoleus sp. MON2_D5]|uniref:hypothetical protein n=1 Tax=Microcoleus sp. MON2_D5 TaxID=2818833 RepID=UPI002FD71AD7